MSLDLAFDDAQAAIAASVAAFCRDHCSDEAVKASADRFPREIWRGVATLGVLALGTPEGDGGALEIVAAMEVLGRSACPGPLVETIFAAQLLPTAEREAVTSARAVVAVGTPPLVPWAPCAQCFVEVDGDEAWLASPSGAIEAVETLAGEPWGRLALVRGAQLGPTSRAWALADLALAAYLAGAGHRLVESAAEHARTRRQFGRAIGAFQAVSHPLADARIALDAATTLARVAAWEWDAVEIGAHRRSAAARLSAERASLRAAHAAHQTFGALGITLAGPAFHVSRRIVQLATGSPGAEQARAALLASLGW